MLYSYRINTCKRVSVMCGKYGKACVESETQQRAFEALERILCQMARDSCKKYRRKRKKYRDKRMFKRR